MSFLSKLCNDYESRVQDSADVTVGSLSDADLREAVRSVLGDNYRLVNIVRHDGDIDLQLESERGDTVYEYKYFEAGHISVDDFKRELSATKLRPVSSYKKKVEDSKGRGRTQDSGDDFYSKKVWGADDSDIARVVRESNPILEHIGWGTNAKRSVDFRMMGDEEVAYVEIPVVAGMTLGDLRDALDLNNLPFPGIVEDSKGCGRAQDSEDVCRMRRDSWLEKQGAKVSDAVDTNWGKTNEDDKNYYVKNENDKDEIFDAAVLLFFTKGLKNEIYWRDVNAEYEYGDEYYGLINYICKCLRIKNDDNVDIVKQAYRGIDTLANLFNYNFGRLQKFAENNKKINYSDFYKDMHYLYANKAYDVLLNTFGDIEVVSDSAGHRCKKCDEGKLSENRRRMSDSDDLSGWERDYSGSLREPAYVKEYGDNIPNMKIVDFTKFGKPAEFHIHTRLLKHLGFDELADILYFTKFDSFSEAADVADRIAAAHDAYYKSLSDIIGE